MTSRSHPAQPGSDGARQADEASRRADPHGTAPAGEAAAHEPTGTPTSHRHQTETAAGEGDARQGDARQGHARENEAPRQEKR